jgi:LysR family transcriptional activator of nhaA
MRWINYHHLLYFWTVAREGSVTRAAALLHLTQPAISTQVRTLERALGERLFDRRGRRLVLTEAGSVVFRYADEIFALGREMQQVLAGGLPGASRLVVGVADAMPKLLTWRLLAPALEQDRQLRVIVKEDPIERLLADLAAHRIDLVMSDAPAAGGLGITAFSHPLGRSTIGVFATPELARRYRRRFPKSLAGAPFILPGNGTTIRRSLDEWFSRLGVQPSVVAEIDDSALLKTFGQAGAGLFAAPTAVAADIARQFGVRLLGEIPHVVERFYAISAERRITHPAVTAITRHARADVFET